MQAVSTTRKTLNRLASAAALIAAVGAMAPAHALVFNLTSTGNANADAGFQAAANFWQLVYIDPITVNVTAGFQALGAGILGQASSTYVNPTFAAFRGAMVTDSSSADDATMVAGLPVGSYSKYINGTTNSSGAAHVQSGITAMRLTSANAKALGMLAGNAAGQDVAITFSTSFSFDFDQSNTSGDGV